MAGNLMVLRTVSIAPGGGMALHAHRQARGRARRQRRAERTAQRRADRTGPAGLTVVNDGSLSHIIVNMGTVPVELIAASIIPDPAAPKP